MNKIRRKTLQELFDIITEAKDNLEIVMDEEEEYKDNMPENLQCSERYEKAQEACDNLYEAISNIEEALECIESAME
jgi:RNA polymerase-binding transcription factor DksA